MLKALKLDSVIKYESDLDPDKGTPKATVFEVKALSARQVARIRDDSTRFSSGGGEDADIYIAMNSANFEFVRHGLKGWKNFSDSDGKEAVFKTEADKKTGLTVVTEDSMNYLPSDLIAELAGVITGFNQLSEEDAKN